MATLFLYKAFVYVHECVRVCARWELSKTHRESPTRLAPLLPSFSLWSGVGWDKACYKNTLTQGVVREGRSHICAVYRGKPWCERVQGDRLCICVRLCVSVCVWVVYLGLDGHHFYLHLLEKDCISLEAMVQCECAAVPGNAYLNRGRGHMAAKCNEVIRILPPVGQRTERTGISMHKENRQIKDIIINFISRGDFIWEMSKSDWQTVCVCVCAWVYVCYCHFLPITELISGLQRIGGEKWQNGKRRRRRETERWRDGKSNCGVRRAGSW